MEKYVPDIQENVRKTYPKFRQGVIKTVSLSPREEQPAVAEVKRWEFANKENDTGFVLQPDSFAFHTTRYKTFPEFLEQFQSALTQIDDILHIGLIERIGLRYVDLVEPQKGEEIGNYLIPGLAGFPLDQLNSTPIFTQMESLGQTPLGTLILRVTEKRDDKVLPPDLSPCGLSVPRVAKPTEQSTFLDFDHFLERSMDFSVQVVVELIDKLHDTTSQAFWATISEYAVERWMNGR
jgi:uncharacterized protein (TIGR04255 family)